ncbi:hypothetical protein BKA65DRAFT_483771 [Rhexocercosporidium sp. MPI-PUGE-AT-0058]|nr:hypothetical protein BKA65DRAFT_483771 [Rhexocercosporidium sp. MPI-PUGE-AT-0058]
MASPPLSTTGATPPSLPKSENVWASLPPLNTIKPEELIRYQIVDWDANNPHHPRYLAGHLLVKSLFRRDHYYWIGCSNPLPKEIGKKAPPPIYFNSPASSTPAAATATSSLPTYSSFAKRNDELDGHKSSSLTVPILSNQAPVMTGHHHLGTNIPNIHSSLLTSSSFATPASSASSATDNLPTHQKKRPMTSKQHEGRNVRATFGTATLKADGKPVGVEKAAEGYLNLGAMGWHFRNLKEGEGME